jgi:hypothetical protein
LEAIRRKPRLHELAFQNLVAHFGPAVEALIHAELAWRFVRWALEQGVPAVQRVLTTELGRLEAEAGESLPPLDPTASGEHGVLSPASQARIRQVAVLEVVLPCARQLLAHARTPGSHGVANSPGELFASRRA